MFRLLSGIVALTVALTVGFLFTVAVTAMRGGIFTMIFIVGVSACLGLTVSGMFRIMFGPRAPRSATAPASSTGRRSFLGYLNPLIMLRYIIVGDPVDDERRAAVYRYAARLDQEERTRQKIAGAHAGKDQAAVREAQLRWLRRRQ